jgi:hypothetical protein
MQAMQRAVRCCRPMPMHAHLKLRPHTDFTHETLVHAFISGPRTAMPTTPVDASTPFALAGKNQKTEGLLSAFVFRYLYL